MRAKFLVTIVATVEDAPMPTDFADFVFNWEGPNHGIVVGMRFCPFCGKKIKEGTQRIVTSTAIQQG